MTRRRPAAAAAQRTAALAAILLLLLAAVAPNAVASTLPRPAAAAPGSKRAPGASAPALGAAALDALQRRFPWTISREEVPRLPWEGLQDNLPELLAVQGRDKEVALIVFNEGFSELALNCLVSLITYGNSPNYIVASVGAASLAYCQALRLPCFDGGNLLAHVNVSAVSGASGASGASSDGSSGGGGGGGGYHGGAGQRHHVHFRSASDNSGGSGGSAAAAGTLHGAAPGTLHLEMGSGGEGGGRSSMRLNTEAAAGGMSPPATAAAAAAGNATAAAAAGAAAAAEGAAAAAVTALSTEADAQRYSTDWFHLVWIKTLVAHAVNEQGYDILFADADVVFLRDAWKTYKQLLGSYGADGSFMYEQGNYTHIDGTYFIHKYLNSGNFLLKHNARTRRLMEMWRVGYEFQINVNGNQMWLNRLEKLGYKICHTNETCLQHKADDWATIKPHPNQFEGVGQMCTPDHFTKGLCSDRRLYVHAVCKEGHVAKKEAFKKLGLWFIHVDPHNPTHVTVQLPTNGSLPCHGPSWLDHYPFSS